MSSYKYNDSGVKARGLDDEVLHNDNNGLSHLAPSKAVHLQQRDVMSDTLTNHQEAYYLYLIAAVGIILNCVVVMGVFMRKPLRKMTSGFLVHACFLDILKSAYCIPIGSNLITQIKPSDCNFFGATFVIIVTISAFNMVAMVCSEAYTFGEANVGGNSRGTLFCVVFGIALVYIGSTILHLGPTLIGGYFEFYSEIGSCSFILGKQTGYVANVMWIIIMSLAMVSVVHFICRLYREIQVNQPNRVSFLVRSSITVVDSSSTSACNVRTMIRDATHRAKMFILNTVTFIICWYPLFFLIISDIDYTVSPKVYQTFSFIAWSQGAIQPVLYICFDRSLNLLSRYLYCDKYHYDIDTIAQLMMNRRRNTEQSDTRASAGGSDTGATAAQLGQQGSREITVDIIDQHRAVSEAPSYSTNRGSEGSAPMNIDDFDVEGCT